MENLNEILTNEEVTNVVEGVAVEAPNNSPTTILGVTAVIAGIGLGAWLLTKKVIIPVIKKCKAKKEAETTSTNEPIDVDFAPVENA